MKQFKETDNLSTLTVGDRLEMNDGTVHEAVKDTNDDATCDGCSLVYITGRGHRGCSCIPVRCMGGCFHFEKVEP